MVINTMKKQTKDTKKPFHLHVEHFFRMPALLVVVVGFLMLAIVKSDSKLIGMVREAYAQGYGQVGSYMREETVRTPLTLTVIRSNYVLGK